MSAFADSQPAKAGFVLSLQRFQPPVPGRPAAKLGKSPSARIERGAPAGEYPRWQRRSGSRYSFQIRSAYSFTARSLEKNPQRATFRIAIRVHSSGRR